MPTKYLQFPAAGVNRRLSLRSAGERQEKYYAPWCVNVRLDDPLDRRLRGGSRTGLTKFASADMGTTIADMVSINVSSDLGGASEILVVLVDGKIKTIEAGTVRNGDAVPASGFLVTGQQNVFAVTTSGVTKIDPKTGQVDPLVATAGTIPTSCTFGAVYRDRLCLSGQDNAIYMSRQGVYGDFDFGVSSDDQQRAVPFQLSLGADVGPKPTAMIPCLDSYLICATARTLWVVQGDPTAGGSLRRVSEIIGIVGAKAWVRTDTSIVFLGEDGLYQVQADGSELKPLSPSKVPDELLNIDVSTTTVSLGYDADRPAIHIYLRTAGGSDTHWMLEDGAFWPMRLQDSHSPRVVCRHKGELLLAGGDGYIRKVGGDSDDGAAIQSHVVFGPFRLGSQGQYGRMLNLHACLAAGGGRVNWRILTGRTAEEAADNAKTAIQAFQSGASYSSLVKGSGNWKAGRSIMVYPRVRAIWCCLWLQSTDKWAFEEMMFDTTS